MTGIRRYEVTSPESSDLRRQIGMIIGGAAVENSVTIALNETGIDIPAADPRHDATISVQQARLTDDGLRVLGSIPEGGTINLVVPNDDSERPEATIATFD